MRNGRSLITASLAMTKTLSMSSPGNKSGRACLRNRDTPVVWIPDGNEGLREARAWYDSMRPELGERFALAVEITIEAIAEHALQFPVVYRSHRRAGVRRFPYGIFFEAQEHQNPFPRARMHALTLNPTGCDLLR
jgi:hypothetical protein